MYIKNPYVYYLIPDWVKGNPLFFLCYVNLMLPIFETNVSFISSTCHFKQNLLKNIT
jgi:hypothetical protein